MAARADTEISTLTTTPQTTTADGNLTIDSSGGIQIKTSGAAVTLNSNNTVINNGVISNGDNDTAGGILIDTSAQNILGSLTSTNTITITGVGDGTSKNGISRSWAGITSISATSSPHAGGAAGRRLDHHHVGDTIAAFRTDAGSFVDGDVELGGSITAQAPATPIAGSDTPILATLGGTLYGNLAFDSTTAGSSVGAASRGILIIGGGIHACATDATTATTAGFACGTGASGLGALINAGKIVVVGQVFVNPASKTTVLEGGTVLGVGASIDGGIFNSGPFTANSAAPVGVFSGNGTNGDWPRSMIDPGLWRRRHRHPRPHQYRRGINSALDNVDPGYSVINRGSIAASPATFQLSTAAMFVEGAAPTAFTCLGSGDFTSLRPRWPPPAPAACSIPARSTPR